MRPDAVHHRVYLLAYDLTKQRLYDRTRAAFLTRAGVLTELARRGYLTDADGEVQVAGTGSAGDPALDEALHQIDGHLRTWRSWMRHDYKQTLDTVEAQLQATRVLSVHKKKVIGIVPKTHITVTHTAVVAELQEHARSILQGSGPVGEIDPTDAAVAALAAAGLVPAVVSRKESHDYKDRIEALTTRAGAIAPGLATAFRGLRTTMVAAQGGMGGS